MDLRNQILDWSEKQDLRKVNNHLSRILQKRGVKGENQTKAVVKTFLRRRDWLESIVELDPRQQIRSYFNEVAREGGPLTDPLRKAPLDIISGFQRAAAFSVWRPTSFDAMSLMIKRQGTGKGLEVKGKSAKKGKLSGKIPFIQIHDDKHKNIGKLGLTRHGRLRVYYKTDSLRKKAVKKMKAICREMKSLPTSSQVVDVDAQEIRWEVDDYKIYNINDFGFGIDISERIFYEACVLRQDIKREGDMETGRPSEPNFQSMNFDSTRTKRYSGIGPRPVVLQTSDSDPLRPQTLVMGYEENSTVKPCVSDFDCFVVGTRGIVYDKPIARDQVDVMKWMANSIKSVLDNPDATKSWSSRWFDILNDSPPAKMKMPRCGFGDPKSYQIMEGAAARSAHNQHGAIRHGAECFNYYFPQEIDDKLLVISDVGDFDGKVPFAYMTPAELQDLMLKKIDDGFVFPLNPKWVIADKGWKRVYDKMMASDDPRTQVSLDTWYPKESGIREQIESICKQHPGGFMSSPEHPKMEGTEAVDLLKQKLKRQRILRRAILKIRAVHSFSFIITKDAAKEKKRLLAFGTYRLSKKRLREAKESVSSENLSRKLSLKKLLTKRYVEADEQDKIQNRREGRSRW
eukprot:CAMPEP_0178933968 /NCGR_PEP_ID=MMETSP0786-20121207/23601_1 /TAXON_ID=186022 /ORGANISM="Thalassionema frauenfeldii, Strain CCMP 1798" /LENGTH=627 /DNA_ID=CAMNT_0020611697 /DNA_START=380 /DNA_END=2260 /DNA_ORIENTATION=-